jgi:hypothetical protein
LSASWRLTGLDSRPVCPLNRGKPAFVFCAGREVFPPEAARRDGQSVRNGAEGWRGAALPGWPDRDRRSRKRDHIHRSVSALRPLGHARGSLLQVRCGGRCLAGQFKIWKECIRAITDLCRNGTQAGGYLSALGDDESMDKNKPTISRIVISVARIIRATPGSANSVAFHLPNPTRRFRPYVLRWPICALKSHSVKTG